MVKLVPRGCRGVSCRPMTDPQTKSPQHTLHIRHSPSARFLVSWDTKRAILKCDDSPIWPALHGQISQLSTQFGRGNNPRLSLQGGYVETDAVRTHLKVWIQPVLGVPYVLVFLDNRRSDSWTQLLAHRLVD